MIAGHNFGCGSSQEHAPWALQDYGFKVIIADDFADIFYNNCFKNGLLAIKLAENEVKELMENAEKPNYKLIVDLEKQLITDEEGFKATLPI